MVDPNVKRFFLFMDSDEEDETSNIPQWSKRRNSYAKGEDERSEGECSTTSSDSPTYCPDSPVKYTKKSPQSNQKSEADVNGKSIGNVEVIALTVTPKISSVEETIEHHKDAKVGKDMGMENTRKLSTEEQQEDKTNGSYEKPTKFAEKSDSKESLESLSDSETEDEIINKLKDQLTAEFKVSLPNIGNLVEGSSKFLRMPSFIPVEPIPFDAQAYVNHMSAEDLKNEQSRESFISRLKTTIRWRQSRNEKGELRKESNARIVRWSDGSETFHIGAEVFDIMHHPVPDEQNQLYVRLGNFYQVQTSIKDKMTLRPKLDSTFGQRHVKGLRNRAMNKPQTGCVKVLMELSINPILDRERKIKEELAQMKKEERDKRRMQQLNLKPRIKPMRHCTADDSDLDEIEEDASRGNGPGIHTNRNVEIKPSKLKESDTNDEDEDSEGDDDDDHDDEDRDEDEDDDDKSDIMDIINDDDDDDDLDSEDEDDTESNSSEEDKTESQEQKKTNSDDSEVDEKTKRTKRKAKQLIYSDSDE